MTQYDEDADRQDDDDDGEGVTCRRCGKAGLYWENYWDAAGAERHRLIDSEDDTQHRCDPTAHDFDDMTKD